MFRTGAAAVPLCSASSSLQIDNKMHNVNCTCHFPNGMVRALSASNSPCALSEIQPACHNHQPIHQQGTK